MAKRKIVKIGEALLHQKSRPVEEVTPRMLALLDDMVETMRAADGVGLAAPQIGVLRRLVVIETPDSGLIQMINPEIISADGEQTGAEGCLSVPGKSGTVTRPMDVTVRYTDRNGKTVERSGSGLLARAFCHELDHLDGKLYVDIAEDIQEG